MFISLINAFDKFKKLMIIIKTPTLFNMSYKTSHSEYSADPRVVQDYSVEGHTRLTAIIVMTLGSCNIVQT